MILEVKTMPSLVREHVARVLKFVVLSKQVLKVISFDGASLPIENNLIIGDNVEVTQLVPK